MPGCHWDLIEFAWYSDGPTDWPENSWKWAEEPKVFSYHFTFGFWRFFHRVILIHSFDCILILVHSFHTNTPTKHFIYTFVDALSHRLLNNTWYSRIASGIALQQPIKGWNLVKFGEIWRLFHLEPHINCLLIILIILEALNSTHIAFLYQLINQTNF